MTYFRRLYLYLASSLSLLLFLAGGISLSRLWFSASTPELLTEQLARALAFLVIGLFSFAGHWSLLQRRLAQYPEEAAAPERPIFLYSLLLVTLFMVILNLLALLDQFILSLLGVPAGLALLGKGQTLAELLANILLCSLTVAYFFRTLQQDGDRYIPTPAWQRVSQGYRYTWLLFSLGLLLIGLQQTVQFILQVSLLSGAAERAALGNGLAFILIAAPLWLSFERAIQKSSPPSERELDGVRLTFNAGIYLILSVCLFFSLGAVLSASLRLIFDQALSEWLSRVTLPLSLGFPLGAVWFTYQRKLNQELGIPLVDPNRAYLQHTLRYSLAWLGLATAFAGLLILIINLINLAIQGVLFSSNAWSSLAALQISRAVPAVAIGLPVWFIAWRKVSRQAVLDRELGESSLLSRPHQFYLSAVVFLGWLGFIFSAGWLVYQMAQAILEGSFPGGLLKGLPPAVALLLCILLLIYHIKLQQTSQRQILRQRSRRYALYPVLILAPETSQVAGASSDGFGGVVASALEREMPGLPIAVHVYTSGVPDETLSAAKAVILSSQLFSNPPESILLWLQGFSGARLVISEPTRNWYWPGSRSSLTYLARLTAHQVRVLAENSGSLRV